MVEKNFTLKSQYMYSTVLYCWNDQMVGGLGSLG